MSSKALLVGGLASLFTIVVWIAVIVVDPSMNFENPSSTVTALLIVGSVATVVAFVGLYFLFAGRGQLNAVMLGLAIVGVGLTLIPSDGDATYMAGAILWGGALLIAGYLLRGGPHSIWLSWLGIATGALFVVTSGIYLAGQKDLANTLNLASSIPLLAWSVWIGFVMLKASRQPTPAPTG